MAEKRPQSVANVPSTNNPNHRVGRLPQNFESATPKRNWYSDHLGSSVNGVSFQRFVKGARVSQVTILQTVVTLGGHTALRISLPGSLESN